MTQSDAKPAQIPRHTEPTTLSERLAVSAGILCWLALVAAFGVVVVSIWASAV
jgi:hypothetical protein